MNILPILLVTLLVKYILTICFSIQKVTLVPVEHYIFYH